MTADALQYARRWKTLAVLSLSLVIIGLDNTILNVALPTLQDEFGASSSKLQWMVDSYLLVFAGLLLVFGTLGDRFGRKLALQAGVSDLRPCEPRRPRRRLRRPGDRRARGNGGRSGADHARHPLDHRQPLQRRGTRQGNRDLGRPGGGRNRPRPADRRAAARVVRLVLDLPGQRPGRGPRAAPRLPLRPGEPGSSARVVRPAGSGTLHRGLQPPRVRHHRSARARLDVRAGARVTRRERRTVRPRSSGGSTGPTSRCSTSASSAARASASARRRSAPRSSPCWVESSRSPSTCSSRMATARSRRAR